MRSVCGCARRSDGKFLDAHTHPCERRIDLGLPSLTVHCDFVGEHAQQVLE